MSLADRLRAGETILTSWNAIPEPMVVEAVARAGFDAVVLDMQHGLFGPEGVARAIGGAAHAGKPVVVRVPVDDFAMASRALDMGAEAIIAPMVNSVGAAISLVEHTKYPPVGGRSWGATRAITVLGAKDGRSYLASANATCLAFAMIETPAALAELEAIASVPGIDGLFVGPWDLSVTLSAGAKLDPTLPEVDEVLRRVAAAAAAAGKFTATIAPDARRAREVIAMGYRMVALSTDSGYIASGAARLIAETRG
jgi:4-hydroxy-2-oxoheptanedioate aldolase